MKALSVILNGVVDLMQQAVRIHLRVGTEQLVLMCVKNVKVVKVIQFTQAVDVLDVAVVL